MHEKLQPLLATVQKNPEDVWSWMQLGNVAKLVNDWDIAYLAYLTASCLAPDNEENTRKFCEARQHYLENHTPKMGYLKLDVFKLPYHIGVVVIIGILNFDTEALEQGIRGLISRNFKHIILDFTGLTYISGLGPSTLRNLKEFVEHNQGKMFVVNQKEEVREMLSLKGVFLTEYPDISMAFKGLHAK